jgi:hypothetical protein
MLHHLSCLYIYQIRVLISFIVRPDLLMADSAKLLPVSTTSQIVSGNSPPSFDKPDPVLCDICSKIDLRLEYSCLQGVTWQEINRDPLAYSVIHMQAAAMIATAETCQLCALVLENIGDLTGVDLIYRRLLSISLGHAGAYETDCVLFGRPEDIIKERQTAELGFTIALFVQEGDDFYLRSKEEILILGIRVASSQARFCSRTTNQAFRKQPGCPRMD